MNMGCTPSLPPSTAVKPADNLPSNTNVIFTIDERLKLKEVWVVVKQSNFKKLGDEIMSRALEKNSALMKYWQNSTTVEQANNFHFDEQESFLNNDLLMKQAFKQHGSKLLDKIDQLIMVMVTKVNATNCNDTILNDYFQRIGQTHSTFKIQQDHIDIICECFLESLRNLMYHNSVEWTIKHELTWMKFFSLITTQIISSTNKTMS